MLSPQERKLAEEVMRSPHGRWHIYRISANAGVPNSTAHRIVGRWVRSGVAASMGMALPTIPGLPGRRLYELTDHGRKVFEALGVKPRVLR